MKIYCNMTDLEINPEGNLDVIFIEEILKLKKDGDSIKLIREDDPKADKREKELCLRTELANKK